MANNTIEILTSINKQVSTIANYLAPKNGNGKEATAKLSKGNISTTDDIDSSKSIKWNLSSKSLNEFIKIIGGLPCAVKAVAGLSGKTMNKFKSTMETISKIMVEVDKTGKDINTKNSENYIKNVKSLAEINKSSAKNVLIAPAALLGATLTYPVIMMYAGIFSMVDVLMKTKGLRTLLNIKVLTKSVKMITNLMMQSALLVVACIAIGALVSRADTQKILLNGLAVLGGTLATLSVIILLTGMIGKMAKAVGAVRAVKEITFLTLVSIGLVSVCLALGALLAQGDMGKILLGGLAVLGGTLVTLSLIILLTGMAGVLIKETGAIRAVKDIVFMTFGVMAILIASKFLADFISDHHEKILVGFGATASVMVSLVGIGWLAGKLLGSAKKGIIALGVIEILAAGAMGLMFMASSLSEKLEGRYDQVTYALLMTTGVIVLFGGLAAAASFIMPEIIMGSVAIGLALLMGAGAIKLIGSILELDKKKDEYGVSWGQLAKDVLGINGVIAAFGLTAAAFSLLTVPILFAIPAMVITIGFSRKVIGVVSSVVDVAKKIDEAGGIQRVNAVLNRDIPSMMKGFNKKNFDMDLSLFQIAKLGIKYAAVAKLSKNLLSTAEAISKIANIGTMTEGGLIRPVLSIDKETGKIVYGEAVDVVGVSRVICNTLKVFVESMDYNFKDLLKMMIGAQMFKIMGSITEPISTFLDMLTGFVGGTNSEGNYTLTPVRIGDDGKITYGAPVPVRDTAITIMKAVNAFVSELYSKENAETWSEMVYGDRTGWQKFWGSTNTKTDAINEIGGMLGVFVSPVVDFINMLSQFESAGPGKLTKLIVDHDGTVKKGGTVDVNSIANTIAGSITSFVTKIYNMPDIDGIDDKTEQLQKVVEGVGNVSKAFADLSNNKDIDTVKLSGLYDNFNKGSKSIIRVAGAISVLDKTIEANNAKRKKNIKELGNAIEELMNKFKDDGNSIRNLYGLVNALQNMDAEEISRRIGAVRSGAASSAIGTAQQTGGYRGPVANVPSYYGLTQQQVEKAIENVLKDLVIQGKTNKAYSSEDEGINDILEAMNNMTFEIN